MPRVIKKTEAKTAKAPKTQRRRNVVPLWKRRPVRLGVTLFGVLAISASVGWGVESGFFGKTYAESKSQVITTTAQLGFTVQEIFVSGRNLTRKEALLEALELKRGTPIFAFGLEDAKARVEKLPWIASATVERHLPDTVMLHVEERRPLARWQRKGKFRIIDQTGAVIAEKDLARFSDLPLIVGDDAPKHAAQIFQVLAGQPELAKRVKAAVRVSARRWNIVMDNGADVRLPEENAGEAWNRFADYHQQHDLLSRDFRMIDLRLPDRMIVKERNGKPKAVPVKKDTRGA